MSVYEASGYFVMHRGMPLEGTGDTAANNGSEGGTSKRVEETLSLPYAQPTTPLDNQTQLAGRPRSGHEPDVWQDT